MTEDFLQQARRNSPTKNIEYCNALFNSTLLIFEDKILSITGHKLALYGLPEPVHDQPELTSKDVLRETSYDVHALRSYMAANVPRLTPDQSHIQGDLSAGQFANKLLQIGNGKIPEDPLT
ncbi:hypothetical protein TNCT_87261 [Trichonephila clavata]|uniref:Uncharacterized protein n=1 Tax=Trichonephila clavata TaxID=2740835 RepID=A0A8X6GVD8_TRICU|nr:hypothetical protein TNCT_87261 [Trichonephila clavata]